jgi:hypothetical protein
MLQITTINNQNKHLTTLFKKKTCIETKEYKKIAFPFMLPWFIIAFLSMVNL